MKRGRSSGGGYQHGGGRGVTDFRKLRRYAYGTSQHLSTDRWALIGEANGFHDPFFSVGSDSIMYTNTLVTNAILRDEAGEDVTELIERYNQDSLGFFNQVFSVFEGHEKIWGSPQAMSSKIYFEFYDYWGITGLLGFHDKPCDEEFINTIGETFEHVAPFYERMYELFRVWAEKDQREREFKHVDFLSPGAPLRRLHEQMGDMLEPDALRERFNRNIGLIKSVGICVFRQAVQCCYPEHAQLIAGRPINPLAIGLDPSKWEEDGLFDPAMAMEPDPNVARDCERVLFELPMMKMTGPSAMSANRLSKECGVHGAT